MALSILLELSKCLEELCQMLRIGKVPTPSNIYHPPFMVINCDNEVRIFLEAL
jgi:hypothetical protein